MNAVARMAVLDLRTVLPYRTQGLVLFGLQVLLSANKPTTLVPALALLFVAWFAAYPFQIADKAGLDTLYAVLPVPRRTVLYGHYAWAVATFLATATVGTTVALVLARAEAVPFGAHTLETMLAVSWALFAVNVAIQFPLFVRFGYTRTSALATILPLAVVVAVVYRAHLTVSSIQDWLPLFWAAGAAVIVASVVVSMTADKRRVH